MNSTNLQIFAAKIAQRNRITFGDVRRLQRNILPDGVSTREEAEILIRLDAQVARVDEAWIDWLVASVTVFVVWGERPTGVVERQAAEWLEGLLSTTGKATKAARCIADEVHREADCVEEPMISSAAEVEITLAQLPPPELAEVIKAVPHQAT